MSVEPPNAVASVSRPARREAARPHPFPAILFAIPWPTNEGYAMDRVEPEFFEIGCRISGSAARTHFAYADLSGGRPRTLPATFGNVIQFAFRQHTPVALQAMLSYVREHEIEIVVGYDLGVRNAAYRALRRAGVKTIVAFWGAPMSSLNRGLKLALKRLDVLASRSRPDTFIFESEAMRATAVHGRGVPAGATAVIHTGCDVDRMVARQRGNGYAHQLLGISPEMRIIVFSGHIHPRKGLDVLLDAADLLINQRRHDRLHFLLLGRLQAESHALVDRRDSLGLTSHVTFTGYRDDIFDIFASCTLGVMPTTGWDSFPRSVLEMQGCGLPVAVSRLHGLPEMIVEGETGYTFPVGDHSVLADIIEQQAMDVALNEALGAAARCRILTEFDRRRMIAHMITHIVTTHAAQQGVRNGGALRK